MKKAGLITIILAISAIFSFNIKAQNMNNKKILVAYYSWSGNTRTMAHMIKEAVQADIWEIIPEKPYPTDYEKCTAQASRDIKAGIKPTLKAKLTNVKDYDVIIVGSPCWWSTIAPPVLSFLSSYDLAGKTIVPFMTHGGSGFGHSIADIKKACPQSDILKGLTIYGTSVQNSGNDIRKWLLELNLAKK